MKNEIKSGAIISYFNILISIVAGLLYTPWMIAKIGRGDYGIFILATAFLNYFMVDFGLGSAIGRFITKYRTEGKDEKINDLLGLTYKIYIGIDIALFVILAIVYLFIQGIFLKLTPAEIETFKVVYIIIGLYSIISFPFKPIDGILIANERFFALKLCDLLNRVFTVVLMIIAILLGYKVYGLVVINAFVGVVIILIKQYIIKRKTNIKINFKFWDNMLLKQLLGFSVWITIISIAQRLLINVTPTILGIFSGTSEITIFSIGTTIEAYTWTFAAALNGLFLPKVMRIYKSENDIEETNALMIRVGRIQLLVVGLIILGFVSMGKQFIELWMGKDFINSYYVAVLMVLPGSISLTQEIAYTKLFVVNELKYRAVLFISASIISVTISCLLSPKYGAVGSSIGIFTGLILCHIVGMNLVYSKVLKIDIRRFFRECHMKMLLPLLAVLIIGFLMQNFIPARNLFVFAIKAGVFALIYIITMWMTVLNKEEKNLIFSILNRMLPPKWRKTF